MAGFEVIFNRLPEVIAAAHAGAVVAVRKVAAEVGQAADDSCPEDTGFLRASRYQVTSDASTYMQATGRAEGIDAFRKQLDEVEHPTSDLEAIIAYAANYASFVHDGTSRVGARPWLQGSLEAVRGSAPDEMAKIIAAAIEQVAK